ncbi:hypothetical protein HMPREF1544_08703 [Mucor circinelloides 1006PhL]|uniref:C2H2-type domain-containing protein n=1 Tax=Mucor circinelloides f. circinelloides (strain 1006PhL) TaxID=1220926 RepID=S2JPK1_MUCC1|nr:hypothetical protein HMPREF1544_08703 [Mucor circinelloides 1006PhL]
MTVQHQNQPTDTWKQPDEKTVSASTTSISSLLNDKPQTATHLPTPKSPHDQDSVKPVVDKPFVCNQCDQSFSRSHNLKSHLATHSPEKPFQCDICNHFFRRQHDLKRHQKLHTGERPYVCACCSRSFARLDALNRHQSAYGGTACNSNNNRNSIAKVVALHLKAGNNANTNNTSSPPQPQRPVIPQINIARPSTQPPSPPPLTSSPTSLDVPSFPTSQQQLNLSLPPLRSNSLSSAGGTSPSLIHYKLNDTSSSSSSPPPFRSWSYPTNSSVSSPPSPQLARTLPSINDHVLLQQQIKHLEHENMALKQELSRANVDKQQMHDLQVENKLLKSLILTQQQDRKRLNDMDETDVAKKVKYESNNDSLKKKCRLE